jgi:hypothetical protein
LLVGTIPPAKSLVSYVYLQEEHALVLSAVLPDEVRDRDMPQFLAMTDSLIVRENP